ncbi:MAG: UbiA family prenyltransferase [Dehalococcoidia bacterium]
MQPHALHLERRPPPERTWRALRAARIIHPFPTFLNVAATAGLGFVATDGAPDAWTLSRMLLVMLCAQSAIGVANDYCDRELDAATKPWKPIAAGVLAPRAAAWLALLLIAATAAAASTLGAGSLALALLGLACGLAYDVRLKRTALSPVPFMVAIPTLPAWVWVTLDARDEALWWLLPLGALAGLSLHLANTLPDIEADARQGVRGLAHRLGPHRAMLLAWSAFALALSMTAVLAPLLDYDLRWYAPAAAVGAGCLVASMGLRLLRRDASALQAGFGLIAVGTLVVAVGWLAAV